MARDELRDARSAEAALARGLLAVEQSPVLWELRLTGGAGSRRSCGSCHLAGRNTTDEPTTNLLSGVQLSSGKRPSAGDQCARTVVSWSFSLEQANHPLSTIGRPCGDDPPIGFAQRLRGPHPPTLGRRSATPN